ncbi:MAG: sulfatase-like hydrolase/transferase, partial [Bacteroidales bacterium]
MRLWFKILLLTGIAVLAGCSEEPLERQPNIILIQADDLGWDDLGIHGNRLIETPNLNSLAGESVRFSQFYVTPVCATTRAALLTGRHFLRTGVSHVHGGKDFLHLDETTIADVMKDAGYVTGMWGKWHSGKTDGYFPWERGFDEAFMARLYDYYDNEGSYNGESLQTEGWITGVLTDMAIDFMKDHREVPFFAYLPYLTCHAPLDAPRHYVEKYLGKGLSENLAMLYGMVEHMANGSTIG